MERVHGTCVEIGLAAVLLRGAPGSGKSDLALRLIDQGARLVTDDWVEVTAEGAMLWASAPAAIAGRIEVRGIGILRLPFVPRSRLRLVADLVPSGAVERLPEPASVTLDGLSLPLVRLAPLEASAPAKLRLLMRALDDDIIVP